MATTTSVPVGLLGESPSPWKAHQLPLLLPLCAAVLAVVTWCAARAAEWAWLRPRRLERALRAQGIRGTAYRPLAGDAPLSDRLAREARSRPPLPPGCHAIVPRAMPLVHHAMNEHGKNSVTWFGPTPRVIITEPELVRQVLSNKFGHFEKVGFGQLMRLLHYGVSTHQGSKWAKHRRIINPAFHLDKLKRMLPAFAACCADMVSRWEALVVAADGEPCEVDVWPEMQRLTGDVISRVAFGSSYLEGRRIFELQEEQVHLAMLVANKIHIPGYMMLPTRVNRRMKRIAAEIEGILRGMIATRESSLRAGKATSDDLLGLLLESNMEQFRGEGEGKGGTSSGGGGMSTDDIIGECKLFYFAGMETTSVLLTWTMLVLSMHQEWQDRAREEVHRVLGDACTVPDYDGLSRLKIVTMVLYEVLRLYTPLPALHRRTYKPMELGGVRYPAGVMLMLPLLSIHHDKDAWGPDADEFRPERFAEGIARASSSGGDAPPAFFPFGWGPRTCIGQTFALLEAKIGLGPASARPASARPSFRGGWLRWSFVVKIVQVQACGSLVTEEQPHVMVIAMEYFLTCALKEAFEVICNKGDSGKSSAKLLATFYDNILKKGCSEKLSDEAIEDAFFEKGLRSIDTVTSFQKMSLSGVLLLDNDRFHKEEEKKDAELAKKLAYVADLLCQ